VFFLEVYSEFCRIDISCHNILEFTYGTARYKVHFTILIIQQLARILLPSWSTPCTTQTFTLGKHSNNVVFL
jgi:hypothetical protein